jgi:hypothetical protein
MPKLTDDEIREAIRVVTEQITKTQIRLDQFIECFNQHDHQYYRADIEDWGCTDQPNDKFWN